MNRDNFELEITSQYFVYFLIDPRNDGEGGSSGVFYVGKGKGARAEAHELVSGKTAKLQKIAEIREAGHNPTIAYATYRGQTQMTEDEAFRLEAALIWALREQLTNEVAGHDFSVEQQESSDVLSSLKTIEFDDSIRALFVWTSGIRGGVSISGNFIAPNDDDSWENARRWWTHGRDHLNALDDNLRAGNPVVLVAFTKGKHGVTNVVNGIWQLSGWDKDEGKVVFKRVDRGIEHPEVAATREKYLGNQVSIDNLILDNPNRRGDAPEGHLKLRRSSKALRQQVL